MLLVMLGIILPSIIPIQHLIGAILYRAHLVIDTMHFGWFFIRYERLHQKHPLTIKNLINNFVFDMPPYFLSPVEFGAIRR